MLIQNLFLRNLTCFNFTTFILYNWVSSCSHSTTLFSPTNLKRYLCETTKSTATTQGTQIPFAYHYVEQISGNFPFFINDPSFSTLLLLRLHVLTLHLLHPSEKKTLKIHYEQLLILLYIANVLVNTFPTSVI